VDVGERDVEIVAARTPSAPVRPLDEMLDGELAGVSTHAGRITVVVSDATRTEPRAAFLDALRRRFSERLKTIAIATGTHGPASINELGLPAWANSTTLVNHNGHAAQDLVELGTTSRGTPVRLHRCLLETDLVIATGCIRPHYFAGFGAGVKTLFPGLGEAAAIRKNHELKTAPGSVAGNVESNPCRLDLEEAVGLLPTPKLLVNGVCDAGGWVRAVVVGDVVEAFRRGVAMARPWFEVAARPGPVVVASEVLPVSGSLYQAAKIAAAVATLVMPGGCVVVVAECFEGIEPLPVVNEAVWRLGVLARLPRDVRLVLVSSLDKQQVARTLLEWAPTVEAVLSMHPGRILVAPKATTMVLDG
jgi:nickel-dependent lactate racemase